MFQFLRDIRLFSETESLNGIALKRRQLVLNGLLLTIILLLSVFAIYNQLRGMGQIAALDLCALAACLFAYIRLRLSNRSPRQTVDTDDRQAAAQDKQHKAAQLRILKSTSLLVSLILMLFLWALAYQGQAENFSLIWTFFLPVFVFMLNGRLLGSALVAVFYLVLFTLAFSQLGQWQDGDWNLVSLTRFVLASLVMVFTCFFSELTLSRAYIEAQKSHSETEQLLQERNRLMLTTLAKQEKLLSDVSHELRTPLSALRLRLEAMKDRIMVPSGENMATLLKQVDQLQTLISDITTASKLSQITLDANATEVALERFLPGVLAPFQQRAAGLGLTLTFIQDTGTTTKSRENRSEPQPTFRARLDEASFAMALGKVLENCLRYTEAPGSISVRLSTEDKRVCISIEDSAPGVEDASHPQLFEPLFRLDSSRSRDTGGAGLGLSVAKSIIVAHQGSICASQSPLGGLGIHISVPAI